MKLREKLAMIWVVPIMICLIAVTFVLAVIVYSFVFLLKHSGTIGALQYLIDQVRLYGIELSLKKLQKQDEKLRNFDEYVKKNEDTSSAVD